MARHIQQRTPSDEEPVQEQIVIEIRDPNSSAIPEVSLEESTGSSSQQQSTGNSNDRPTSPQRLDASNGEPITPPSTVHGSPSSQDAPNSQSTAPVPSTLKKDERINGSEDSTATSVGPKRPIHRSGKQLERCIRCQDLNKDQQEPRKCDDCVRASGDGKKRGPSPSEKQNPSKTAQEAPSKTSQQTPSKAAQQTSSKTAQQTSSKTAQQTPSKTARTGVWCKECTELKTKPGEDGRKRKNAKYRCKECAALREKAGLSRGKKQSEPLPTPSSHGTPPAGQPRSEPGNSRSTPNKAGPNPAITPENLLAIWQRQNKGKTAQPASNKQWKLAVVPNQQQERNRGFDPGTESDEPNNPPECIKNSPVVDVFGKPKDHSEFIRQIQRNCRRWQAQPPAAAGPSFDFLGDDGTLTNFGMPVHSAPAAQLAPRQVPDLPVTEQAPGHPVPMIDPALSMNDPSQVAAEPHQPLRYEVDIQVHTLQIDDPTSSLATNNARGPQQQQPGEESGALALLPPGPDPFLGAPEPSTDILEAITTHPDPMEGSGEPEEPSYFDDAWDNIQRSNMFENLYRERSEERSDERSDFWGINESAAQATADPPAPRSHPGVQASLIDPRLSAAPPQPVAFPRLASSIPAFTNNNQNNGEPDESLNDLFDQHTNSPLSEGEEDMWNQYINWPPPDEQSPNMSDQHDNSPPDGQSLYMWRPPHENRRGRRRWLEARRRGLRQRM